MTLPDPSVLETAKPSTPGTIEVKGKAYTPEALADLVEKGENATAKWQEAADLRRAVEAEKAQLAPAIALAADWARLPQAVQTEVLALIEARSSGNPVTPVVELTGYKVEDLSDEGKALYGAVQQQFAYIRELSTLIQGLNPVVQDISRRDQDQLAVEALRAQGHNVTLDTVKQMRASGITDPVKAYALFAPHLKPAASQGAAAAAPVEAPVGESNVFDDSDPNLNADDLVRLMAQGFIPKSSLTKK